MRRPQYLPDAAFHCVWRSAPKQSNQCRPPCQQSSRAPLLEIRPPALGPTRQQTPRPVSSPPISSVDQTPWAWRIRQCESQHAIYRSLLPCVSPVQPGRRRPAFSAPEDLRNERHLILSDDLQPSLVSLMAGLRLWTITAGLRVACFGAPHAVWRGGEASSRTRAEKHAYD